MFRQRKCNQTSSSGNAHICTVVSATALLLITAVTAADAQFRSRYANLPGVAGRTQPRGTPVRRSSVRRAQPARQTGPAGVYPEFRSSHGVIRWLREQMPIKVWVSPGLAIDTIIDPKLGAPVINTDNTKVWPDLIADVVLNDKLKSLPVAEGYSPQHREAAVAGILSWQKYGKNGELFSYELTDNPMEASAHVFFVHHFVNKLGLALFANDIRGYTAKRSFPRKLRLAGKIPEKYLRPVVVVLRCTDKDNRAMPLAKMRAAAAHEMGHVLGIEGHSRNPTDLMHVNYGRGKISPNDAATVRYLYKLTPNLIP